MVLGYQLSYIAVIIKSANLALKFLLELVALAAFAVWGADSGSSSS
jgi:hypothetical protein